MRGMRGGGAGGGVFNVGKAKAQMFDKENAVKTTFKDVAGLEEAKVEIMEIVDFLKKPEKYKDLGGKIPKGALLVGPPGTGKTLLAKAVAGEANVPFFSISGSDFVEMFVGVGASRVRDLFRQAKEKAPCIVFIDEIDAIGRARGKNAGFSSNDERENTLNQLLTEMDGFGTNTGVIILAATNRADILDKALMRAGRFDRQIEVGLPELNERREIFEVHLKGLKLTPDLDREFLAKQTPGFSGADIANVCNEAALIAARRNKNAIEKQDFLDAIDRIVGGLERKSMIITQEEKRITAFHEAGHATVSWLLKYAHPLIKVTIIPRGRSLGAAWYLPDERHNKTRDQFMHEMASSLAGKMSEQIFFGISSTGAISDLERVTKAAYAMVAYYGMSDKIGARSYYDSTGQSDMSFTKPFSEKTAQEIDDEVRRIIDEAQEMARNIIENNKEGLTQLAEKLLEREVIFTEDVEHIFGKSAKDIEKERIDAEMAKAKSEAPVADSAEEEDATRQGEERLTLEDELTDK
jgi:cell division protease FtsH